MSEQIKDGGPAFPIPVAGCNDGGVYNTLQQSNGELGGMTLRDYFAGKELTNMSGRVAICDASEVYARVADHCYRMADAMLAAREVKA